MTTSPRKTGTKTFKPESFQLQEFRQCNCSDLLRNTLRGHLAEFLIAKAVGPADGVRTEWDAATLRDDLQGIKILRLIVCKKGTVVTDKFRSAA
jgi:hypothetical protein